MPKVDELTELVKKWLQEIDAGRKESAKECLSALKSSVEKLKSPDQFVPHLMQCMTKNLSDHENTIEASCELTLWLMERVKRTNHVLISLWNYIIVLYSKKELWKSLLAISTAICVEEESLSPKDSKMYLDLTTYFATVYYSLHHQKGYSNEAQLVGLQGNFCKILKISVESKNFEQYVEYVKKVFDTKYQYGQYLISTDAIQAKVFLTNLLGVLEKLSNNFIEDKSVVSETFLTYTNMLEIFISFEMKNNLNDYKLTQKFIGICKKSKFLPDIERLCVEVLEMLCDIFVKRKLPVAEKLCEKFQRTVENLSSHIEEPAVLDTFATIALILNKWCENLYKDLTIGACILMIRSLNTPISIRTGNRKNFCKYCSNNDTKKHCITMLISVALKFLGGATQKSQNVPAIAFEVIVSYIKHNFYILGRLQCSQRDKLSTNFWQSTYNTMTRVTQKNIQHYVLKIMQLLLENCAINEHNAKYRTYILRFLLKFYTEIQNDMQQALNVGVLHLLVQIEQEKWSVDKIIGEIRKSLHYGLYEFRDIRPTNLVDIIEDESFSWYGVKVNYDACELLVAQISSYETMGSKPLYVCAMKKLRNITKDPKILTSAFLHIPEQLYGSFSEDLENLLKVIGSEENYADRNLHMGFLHYANFYLGLKKIQGTFYEDNITEVSINNQEWKILEKINMEDQIQNILHIRESLKFFQEFTKNASEMHPALKIMKNMAYDAKLYGLVKESITMYDVIYQISSKINHEESIITSLSNILFYWKMYEDLKSSDNIVKQMIEENADLISREVKNFDSSNEKHQALVIGYLLNYALYSAAKGSIASAQSSLGTVLEKIHTHNGLKYLELGVICIEYLITIKYIEKCHMSHCKFMQLIINYLKSGIKFTRETVYILPLEVLRELVEYSVVRFDTNGINLYVLMILKYFLKTGMMLQVADILLIAAKIDLAVEKVENCKSKLFYFIKILHLDTLPNGAWINSWQKNDDASANDIIPTEWEAVESARSMFLNHKMMCQCFLCLQSKLTDVSQQMMLFFVWILFNEKQYDKCIQIYNDLKLDGIPQPYELKSREFVFNALMKMGKNDESLKECKKTMVMCENLQIQRTASLQGVQIQMMSLEFALHRTENIPRNRTDGATGNAEKSTRNVQRIITSAEFQFRLEVASDAPGQSEGSDRSPRDGKVGGKVNDTVATRKRRQVKEKKDEKETKKAPVKTVKKTTRSMKRM